MYGKAEQWEVSGDRDIQCQEIDFSLSQDSPELGVCRQHLLLCSRSTILVYCGNGGGKERKNEGRKRDTLKDDHQNRHTEIDGDF